MWVFSVVGCGCFHVFLLRRAPKPAADRRPLRQVLWSDPTLFYGRGYSRFDVAMVHFPYAWDHRAVRLRLQDLGLWVLAEDDAFRCTA